MRRVQTALRRKRNEASTRVELAFPLRVMILLAARHPRGRVERNVRRGSACLPHAPHPRIVTLDAAAFRRGWTLVASPPEVSAVSKSRLSIDHDKVLGEEQQAAFELREALWARIQDFTRRKGLSPEQVRVLDWGCGRGRTVFWLRDRGYDAYGVDIDARPVKNGRELARRRGLDAERVLTYLDAEGRAPYPDGFFHFLCSDQVIEHVRDIDAVAREMVRLLAPGGGGAHLYGATFLVFEGHMDMPFVHWLPKNKLRLWLIRLWVWLGIEAKLPAYQGLSRSERAEKFYAFSVGQTFYRTVGQVERAFRRAGLEAYADTINGASIRRHPLTRRFVGRRWLGPIANWFLSRFVSTHLVLEKPEGPGAHG
jgi:SAM-dependent methyltransferase